MSTPNGAAHEDAELSLAAAFTREHHQIDEGIEAYLRGAAVDAGTAQRARPLLIAMEALRRHIYLEEEVVFPHLPPGPLMMPLMVMRREHGELWKRMAALSETLAEEAADSTQIATACTELLSLLEDHNQKEEPIIYPHLDADLSPDEQATIRQLLEGGSLPEGWICQVLR